MRFDFFKHLWKRIFPSKTIRIIPYGRGIHAHPNPNEQQLFDDSSRFFMEHNTIEGYRCFFESIRHSDGPEHLILHSSADQIEFTLFQSSAIIHGHVSVEHFYAYARIADASRLNVATKRRLLERNFQLTYAHFSQKEGQILLSIELHNTTITPQKIFFPLRELALNADFEKEFIASEFDEAALLETDHITPLQDERLQTLYTTMHLWIDKTKESLVGLLSNDNNGMASFSYLALLLQIDYLLLPRKKIAREINEKINGYFLDDEKLTTDKNSDLESYLNELATMSFDSFRTQFYNAPTTFSVYDPAMHDDIASFIDESLAKVRWYKNNHVNYVIPIIYRYIALYALFNYGLHPSLRALFHLHVEIYTADFFTTLGEKALYDPATKTFDTDLISDRIANAITPYTHRYKNLRNFAKDLNYSDCDHFSQSLYLNIKNLDFQEL